MYNNIVPQISYDWLFWKKNRGNLHMRVASKNKKIRDRADSEGQYGRWKLLVMDSWSSSHFMDLRENIFRLVVIPPSFFCNNFRHLGFTQIVGNIQKTTEKKNNRHFENCFSIPHKAKLTSWTIIDVSIEFLLISCLRQLVKEPGKAKSLQSTGRRVITSNSNKKRQSCY